MWACRISTLNAELACHWLKHETLTGPTHRCAGSLVPCSLTSPVPESLPIHLDLTVSPDLYTMKLVGWLVALVASPLCTASILPQEPFDTDVEIASSKKLTSETELLEFHKTLVRIESISGNEKEVGEWLAFSLKLQGYTVEKQHISKEPERFNVLAWPGKTRDAEILVSSHIDTVCLYIHTFVAHLAKLLTRSLPSFHTTTTRLTTPSSAVAPLTPKEASPPRSLLSTASSNLASLALMMLHFSLW